MRKDLRILLVGLGSIGIRHLTNLRSLGYESLAVYRRVGKPTHTPVDLEGVAIHRDYAEALAAGADAVFICTPTALHYEQARQAIIAGCDVYLEKPVADRIDHAEDLLQLADRHGTTCAVGCQLRSHPGLRATREWLEGGRIGRPLSVLVDTGEYLPGWHPWEDYRQSYASRGDLGGGVILTLIHELDYLYWLFGKLAVRHAVGGTSGALDLDVDDHVTAMLETEEGLPIVFQLDYLQRPPSRTMKVIGTAGTIFWDYYSGVTDLYVEGELSDSCSVDSGWSRNDMFVAMARDFFNAIAEERAPCVPLSEGVEVLRTALELRSALTVRARTDSSE